MVQGKSLMGIHSKMRMWPLASISPFLLRLDDWKASRASASALIPRLELDCEFLT